MNSAVAISDDDAADFLKQLRDVTGTSPFMTPEAAALMMTTIMRGLEKVKQHIEGTPGIKQEWGTCSDIGKIYGKDRCTISRILRPLAAEGKVRVCTTKDGTTGAYGGSMYNLADVQRNFIENAREVAKRQAKAS